MNTVLDVAAAWTALDIVLLGAWHFAHVQGRRNRHRLAPVAVTPLPTASARPGAAAARHLALVRTG